MDTRRLYVNWVVFTAWVLFLFCTVGSVSAAPANWIRSDEGLTLTSSSSTAPALFSFDGRVYVHFDTALYVQLYNNPCFGWQQVTVPAGSSFFKPVGDHLYAGGSDLWWAGLGGYATLPAWNKVSSTGVPTGAIILPEAIFKGQLYAEVIGPTPDLFDIYRTPDIGKTSMAWTKVVSAGFMNPLNHSLGRLIEYNNKLIAVTTNTRTDPNAWFGDWRYYGTGIEVWESPSGNLGSWTQVNQDGFGTEGTVLGNPPDPPTTIIRTNQDFGSAAVYNGYLFVGTKAHTWHSGEVWKYDGTGLNGWTNVTPEGMCAGMFGCGGPSRANGMIVYNNLLYLAEGVSTGNLETFDGATWTIVVGSEIDDPLMGHPFDAANIGISSLAVFPSLPTPSGGSTGDKLFALTTTSGGAQIWSYPFSEMPPTCTALNQATIAITPKTSTTELLPGATHTFNVKVDAGTGFDFGQVFVTLEVCVSQSYYGGGGGQGCAHGWVSDNGMMTETYGADLSGPTPPLNPLYPDQIRACFFNSENFICDTATHTWVDTIPPTITITTPTNGAKYLLSQVVSAQYSVYDAVGVLSTTAPVPVGGPIPTGKLGNQTFTVTAKDYGNNTATKSVTYTVLAPPVAQAGPDQTVLTGLEVSFDGSSSNDPDGTIVAYAWNFGDGTTGTGATPKHAYTSAGLKTVTLTVKDNDGLTGSDTVAVTVKTPVKGTQDLKSGVTNSPLPQDIKTGLNDKLNAAINALNLGNKKAAINILGAFINMINAQRGKAITNAQADSWVAEAQKIINSINAS